MSKHLILIEEDSRSESAFPRKGPIFYDTFKSLLGPCTVAGEGDVLFYLGFDEAKTQAYLSQKWPKVTLARSRQEAEPLFEAAMACCEGRASGSLRLILRGTDFQRRVWKALLALSSGEVISYEALAVAAGKPKAVRAAGTALGNNPVSLLVPCHRIIRKDGSLGGFGWGLKMKQQILDLEKNGKFA